MQQSDPILHGRAQPCSACWSQDITARWLQPLSNPALPRGPRKCFSPPSQTVRLSIRACPQQKVLECGTNHGAAGRNVTRNSAGPRGKHDKPSSKEQAPCQQTQSPPDAVAAILAAPQKSQPQNVTDFSLSKSARKCHRIYNPAVAACCRPTHRCRYRLCHRIRSRIKTKEAK